MGCIYYNCCIINIKFSSSTTVTIQNCNDFSDLKVHARIGKYYKNHDLLLQFSTSRAQCITGNNK